jgi:hypothetical protein
MITAADDFVTGKRLVGASRLGIVGLIASPGDRSYGLVGAVTALIGMGLPVFSWSR